MIPAPPPLPPALLLGAATGVLSAMLVAIAVIDARTQRIPDGLNAALGAMGLVAIWALGLSLSDAAIGAAAGYAALAGMAHLYFHTRGFDGLGLGDAKLFAAGGAWIGWLGLPFALLLAASAALALVAAQRVAGRAVRAHDRLAFGPFLAVGIMIVWLVQRFAV